MVAVHRLADSSRPSRVDLQGQGRSSRRARRAVRSNRFGTDSCRVPRIPQQLRMDETARTSARPTAAAESGRLEPVPGPGVGRGPRGRFRSQRVPRSIGNPAPRPRNSVPIRIRSSAPMNPHHGGSTRVDPRSWVRLLPCSTRIHPDRPASFPTRCPGTDRDSRSSYRSFPSRIRSGPPELTRAARAAPRHFPFHLVPHPSRTARGSVTGPESTRTGRP